MQHTQDETLRPPERSEQVSDRTLTDRLGDALDALEAIRKEAADRDNRVANAEARAAEAEKRAEKHRRERDKAAIPITLRLRARPSPC